jgi:hypothetical protein
MLSIAPMYPGSQARAMRQNTQNRNSQEVRHCCCKSVIKDESNSFVTNYQRRVSYEEAST